MFEQMLFVFVYRYAKNDPNIAYGNIITIIPNIVDSPIVCSNPNVIPLMIMYAISFFISLFRHPLNSSSSTIGAYITASGIVYQIGSASIAVWFFDIPRFSMNMHINDITKYIRYIIPNLGKIYDKYPVMFFMNVFTSLFSSSLNM